MKQKKIIIAVAVAIIAAGIIGVVVASTGKSTDDQMIMSSDSAVAANTVSIKNYMFTPMAITVKVGTKVTWTNEDAVAHTITADTKTDGAPDSMNIGQHESYSFTFTKAGTFTYHCAPHPYMKGTVTVTE